jgi:hypothetical protein
MNNICVNRQSLIGSSYRKQFSHIVRFAKNPKRRAKIRPLPEHIDVACNYPPSCFHGCAVKKEDRQPIF